MLHEDVVSTETCTHILGACIMGCCSSACYCPCSSTMYLKDQRYENQRREILIWCMIF